MAEAKNIDLKVRAMVAKDKLRSDGHMNYVPLIIRRHPEANSIDTIQQIHAVANGRKADLKITEWLEELVLEFSKETSAA